MLVRDLHHLVGINVAADHEHHIVKIVERVVAVIERFRCDVRDALDRAADVLAYRVMAVHTLEHTVKAAITRVVVIHPYFLGYYSYLVCDRLGREIGVSDEIYQLAKRRSVIVGAREEVRGLVERGVGVRIRAESRELLKRVASVLVGKELVLEKMRNSVGNRDLLATHGKAAVERAVLDSHNCVGRGQLLGKNYDRKARGVLVLSVFLAEQRAFVKLVVIHRRPPRPPRRKPCLQRRRARRS